ncbi:mechanosensitive ion channel family protein [Evansella cellulosilytica]|uniref:MscS Mechanosensitive ion channel n=1 Tax=Evansella cellulosilytica (strain ATCC 21833 / DSM 2522 / FERM P-1141 / JCM 9156 / N-4) TaxID=649639 RepID=E6TUP4_EVAC2|nr:mechanosensitive ion channel family protein [Evansella cellulosilytica]ADU30934.1 MscS Mechanosensitive ion channel [Evansella cellulosilytica DSM 2522]
MNEWLQSINWDSILTNLLTGAIQLIIILAVFFTVRAIGTRLIRNSFERMSSQKNMSVGRVKTLEKLALNIFSYILIFIVLTFIVGIFGFNVTGLIAGAGIIGLAVGFGAQGLVSDIVTGFFILLEKQLEVEEYVTVAGIDGIVEEVGLRTTKIRGFDGTVHFIPNREIGSLSNHSRSNMRALVDISIAYDENIDEAIAVIQNACDTVAANESTIKEGPDVVGVQSLGDSDVVIRIIAKTENMEQWAVERKLRKAIKESLDANNIEIPFPHQVYIEKKQ